MFHIICVLLVTIIYNALDAGKSNHKQVDNFKIQKVSPELLKRLRTVGKKNGVKNIFSTPLKIPQGTIKPKATKALNFKNLSNVKNNKKIRPLSKGTQKKEVKKNIFKVLNNKQSQTYRLHRQQQDLQQKVLDEVSASRVVNELIRNKGFNVQFETPEGFKEDELNTIEKKLYGFQKRMFKTYIDSLIINMQKHMTTKPYIKKIMENNKHLLKGRVIFDKEGNIVSIKIFKSSKSDEVHALFEDSLTDMKSLPNPPQLMLEDKEEFTIYYTFKIN
jgi:hypothetical protein